MVIKLSYGRTCFKGAHVLWEVLSYRRTCLTGGHVLGGHLTGGHILPEDMSYRQTHLNEVSYLSGIHILQEYLVNRCNWSSGMSWFVYVFAWSILVCIIKCLHDIILGIKKDFYG